MIAVALALMVVSAAPHHNALLGQAKAAYEKLEFEQCLAKLGKARKARSTSAEKVEIELYTGLCAYDTGDQDKAIAAFTQAAKLDPAAELPSGTSPKIVSVFEAAKLKVAPQEEVAVVETVKPPKTATPSPPTEAAKPAPVEEPAAQKPQLEPSPTVEEPQGPLSKSTETQVEEPKSYAGTFLLGGLAVAAAGFGAYMGVSAKQDEAAANGAHFESDAYALGAQARSRAMLANAGFGAAAAAATAAFLVWAF